MKFNIPLSKIEKLEAYVRRIANKGAKVTYTRGEEVVCDGTLHILDDITHIEYTRTIKVHCVEVEVEGVYKINDWVFVGTIEHMSVGNIIRLADSSFEGKVPERYNKGCFCEHCRTQRYRKDTYLIYNEKTEEFKQVGKNCLMEYTNGLDATVCAGIMSCLDVFAKSEYYGVDYDEFTHSEHFYGYDNAFVKRLAIEIVLQDGYQKSEDGKPGTRYYLAKAIYEVPENRKFSECVENLVAKIDEYAKSITNTYGYMYNAKVVWLSDTCEYRDLSLVASFVSVYLREEEKRREAEAEAKAGAKRGFVGEIGKRTEFTVKDVRVLYSKGFDRFSSVVCRIVGEDDQIYIWSTSWAPNVGERIRATVKEHNEFRGEKQTVVTRGTII